MIQAILAGALIVAASLVCGQALMLASGRRSFSPVAPALGLSALLVICGVAVKLPGHGVSAAIAAGIAVGVSAWFLWRDRGGLGSVSPWAIAAAVLAALVVAIPFATSGRVGILGQGLVNDDMASHLLFTEWVDAREGPTPDLIEDGYPLGPHAIVSAASKATGADLIEAFAGLTGAIAALAALTAFGALGGLRAWFRIPAAALAALPYLGAAYLAQGAFKEPMMALALLGFALSLPALRECWWGYSPTIASTVAGGGRDWLKGQARVAIPGGVIAAGTIYNYSFPGLAWLVVCLAAWGLIVALYEKPERQGLHLRSRLRWARPALITGVAIPFALALPELVRIVSFAGFEAFSPSGTEGNTGFGNLRQALNPLESLGVWPSSEFRIAPQNSDTPVLAFYLGGLLALAALAWGVGRAVARREAALPAALVAGASGYLVALAVGTPYTSAKALAIGAPVVMLVALRGLLSAEPVEGEDEGQGGGEEGWWPPALVRPVVRFAVPALAVAFVAAAAFSTLLPLRQSAVGPRGNTEVLKSFRPLVEGKNVLFLGRDNFISWELLGAEVYSPILNHYDTEETATLYRATPINAKFDWDNVPNEVLAEFDVVLTTSAALNSEAPPQFEEAKRTEDFVLWARRGGEPTPSGEPGERRTLLEPLYPGTTVDCADPGKAGLTKVNGTATVLPRAPVIGKSWEPGPEPTDSRGAAQTLELTPGSWAISIQYASTQVMTISAPGLDREMRANLLFRGPSTYYPVGVLNVAGEGVAATGGKVPVEFTVRVGEPPLAGRILGTEARAYLGTIAATPIPGGPLTEGTGEGAETTTPRERVPLGQVCGRYVDWYSLQPGSPAPESLGVEAPEVRPPQQEE